MLNLPLQPKYLFNPLILILLAIVLYLFEPASSELLRYQRVDVLDGQLWRIFSGNFVHTNFAHVLLNSAGIVFIWVLHAEHFTIGRYFGVLTFCCITSGLGVHYVGELDNYAGLSGALHGVIVYGAVKDIESKVKFGWALLIGTILKVAYENIVGPTESVSQLINASVAVEAHLFGLLGGLTLAAPTLYPLIIRATKPQSQ